MAVDTKSKDTKRGKRILLFYHSISHLTILSILTIMYNMTKINVTASELKKNVSEILNSVYFEKRIAVIERYGKPIAEIVPVRATIKNRRKDLERVVDKYFGAIPDFPDVTKMRRSRKKKFSL